MRATRIYTGPDEESHFEDIDLPQKYYGGIARLSEFGKEKSIMPHEAEEDFSDKWRTAPNRQFIILLDELELEVGGGEMRHFFPGDILLDEDTEGHGHIGHAIGRHLHKAIFVNLND